VFKPHVQDQGELFPPRVGDLVPEDELCRVVSEVVDCLDLRAVAGNYSVLGQNAYSPRTMLKLLFFGYARGVRSSRAIADAVCFDVRFRWLAGDDRPGKSAIADFRVRNLAVIEDLFVQVVLLCRKLGMIKFGHWSIDGTKLKACAGKNAHRGREFIEADLAGLREQIREALAQARQADDEDDDDSGLPPAIRRKQERAQRLEQALETLRQNPEHKRANTTDPDAPKMKRKGGGFEPSYNPQITVDADSQVVLAADVCTDQTDHAQLINQLDQAQANAGLKPKEVSADTGYASGPNLAEVEKRGITGYIPLAVGSNERKQGFNREDFRYEPEHDRFLCPAGKTLPYQQTKTKTLTTGTYKARVYR
jgi:transposase